MEFDQNHQKLTAIRLLHTAIYMVMVSAIFYIIYAALTKTYGPLLYVTIALVTIEGLVFFGNGAKCPLTALSQKYAGPDRHVSDTYLPEKFTRHSFRIFGPIAGFGFAILLLNSLGWR